MHITIDLWLPHEDGTITPNYTGTGIQIRPVGTHIPSMTLYLGHSEAEIEASRRRINEAIDGVLEKRRNPEPRRE